MITLEGKVKELSERLEEIEKLSEVILNSASSESPVKELDNGIVDTTNGLNGELIIQINRAKNIKRSLNKLDECINGKKIEAGTITAKKIGGNFDASV